MIDLHIIYTLHIGTCVCMQVNHTNYIHIGKSDTDKDFRAESALRRSSLSWQTATNIPWLLSKDEIELAAVRLRHVSVTPHFDPRYLFTNPSRLKSHDWKQVMIYVSLTHWDL